MGKSREKRRRRERKEVRRRARERFAEGLAQACATDIKWSEVVHVDVRCQPLTEEMLNNAKDKALADSERMGELTLEHDAAVGKYLMDLKQRLDVEG